MDIICFINFKIYIINNVICVRHYLAEQSVSDCDDWLMMLVALPLEDLLGLTSVFCSVIGSGAFMYIFSRVTTKYNVDYNHKVWGGKTRYVANCSKTKTLGLYAIII